MAHAMLAAFSFKKVHTPQFQAPPELTGVATGTTGGNGCAGGGAGAGPGAGAGTMTAAGTCGIGWSICLLVWCLFSV